MKWKFWEGESEEGDYALKPIRNSTLLPLWERPSATLAYIENITRQALGEKFFKENACHPSFRQLLTDDLGIKSWFTPRHAILNNPSWYNWMNVTIKEETCIAIFGVRILSDNPTVMNIRMTFSDEEKPLSIYDLRGLTATLPVIKQIHSIDDAETIIREYGAWNKLSMIGYFSDPHIFGSRLKISIDLRGNPSSVGGDEIMLVGLIAEKLELYL